MKKRRSTVLVSPGKDVTLYIPSDTPPEVISYMNRLKAEGMFSQGVMDILTRHILQEQPAGAPVENEVQPDHADLFIDDFGSITEPIQEPVHEPMEEEEDTLPVNQEAFNPDQIFLQASRNAGKLMR